MARSANPPTADEGKKASPHASGVKTLMAQHKAGHVPHLTHPAVATQGSHPAPPSMEKGYGDCK